MAAGVSIRWGSSDADEAAPLKTVERATWSELPDRLDDSTELCRSNLTHEGGLLGCLVCGHRELYTQKDFPRSIGIAIVVVAALLAPFTYYLSLAAAALIDAFLYACARDVTLCYVCHSEHRGFATSPRHPGFDREIDERLRYGERAVMGKPMRESGTANAPEPEH